MSEGECKSEVLPDRVEFAFASPLYTTVTTNNYIFLSALKGVGSFKFDLYCVGCGREATFETNGRFSGVTVDFVKRPGEWELTAKCTREDHPYYAYFIRRESVVMKVGQYPSIADIEGASIKKYRPLLRDGYFPELSKAIGLASHGVGIGSFVYLRRIFEKLIWDHYTELVATSGPINGFEGMRMVDKIGALAAVIPKALVANKAAYAILSKGIHELDEDECKLYFPVVKAAIINILEEDFQTRESEQAAADVAAQVAKIAETLKKG